MRLVLIMGVSGSGKSTLGKKLSKKLSIVFFDADDFHTETAKLKMAKGIALEDEDRWPWLLRINKAMRKALLKETCILACSALKESYRELIFKDIKIYDIIMIKGSYNLIKKRLENRKSHFMKSDLLKTQFDILEEPNHALRLDAALSTNEQCTIVLKELNKLEDE